MAVDVKNLPPAYQAQAFRKWAEQERKKGRGHIPFPAADAPQKARKYHNKPTERVTASGAVLRFDSPEGDAPVRRAGRAGAGRDNP